MLKSLLKLDGVRQISKSEQKSTTGGWVIYPGDGRDCGWNQCQSWTGRCGICW